MVSSDREHDSCMWILEAYDTEPAMIQLVNAIVKVRSSDNIATELEAAAREFSAHGAFEVKR